ncbi:diguanylate cyclase [uncultured Xylophilus sp.]|uniref:sensor domain-containing diguanylate cyclase n=1 Tax=uncultured Xylophilus sp. TaxID=296832 RepID=UPI0025EE313B|nr:diguanylate cyclase [uncultured Xylophilus sp.]
MEAPLILDLLESLGIAACTFDGQDCTERWNGTFLHFFPEHAGRIHRGEPYEENLRRFYRGRLSADEMPLMERYVADGVARHRSQSQPYVFQHRDRWLRVASLPGQDGHRVRIWVEIASPERATVSPFGMLSLESGSPYDKLAEGVLVLDPDGLARSYNPAFAQLYRVAAPAVVLGRSYGDIVAQVWREAGDRTPQDPVQRSAQLHEYQRFPGAPFEVSLPDDRWMRVIVHPTQDGQQISMHSDITQLIRQQRDLRAAELRARESEARFRGAFDQAGIATCMLDAFTLRFVAVNDALCRLAAMPRDALLACHFGDVAEIAGISPLTGLMAELRSGLTHFLQREGRLTRTDAAPIPVQLSFTPIRDAQGRVASLMVHLEDIRLRKRAEEQRDELLQRLEHQATHDMLTGLANRMLLQQSLADATGPMAADGPPRSHALCYLDLDGFKRINDSGGHAAGDAALQSAAALFGSCVRPGDLVARIGGDEFAVVLWNCGEADARAVAERIVALLQERGFGWQGTHYPLGVSIGLHVFGPDDSPDRAMAQADAACYAAKRAGRGQVRISSGGGSATGGSAAP